MSEVVLATAGVAKDYGRGLGLRPTDLVVRRHELVMLVGANGTGKSTLLALCAGLLEPTEGDIDVLGSPVGSVAARRATAYAPDAPVLYEDLSVWEHIEYVAGLHGVTDWRPRGEDLLQRFDLTGRADDLPATFSRGLRQKAALVVTLIRRFDLLLIDEPFVGLDAPAQDAVVDLLADLARRRAAVIVATHQFALTRQATRCVGLLDGETTYDGPADEAAIRQLVSG